MRSRFSDSAYSNSIYLSAALALVAGALIGAHLFASSPALDATKPVSTQKTQVDGSAFRYGPEINHGRSDTPVYAQAQALREARGMAPDSGQRQNSRGWSGRGASNFMNRGLTSGH